MKGKGRNHARIVARRRTNGKRAANGSQRRAQRERLQENQKRVQAEANVSWFGKHCALQRHEDLSQPTTNSSRNKQLKKEHGSGEKYADCRKITKVEGRLRPWTNAIDEMKRWKGTLCRVRRRTPWIKERVRNYRRRIKDISYAAAGGYGFEREYYSSDEDWIFFFWAYTNTYFKHKYTFMKYLR